MCKVKAQVGTLTVTSMGICNQYSFSIFPNQTITPLNYRSQGILPSLDNVTCYLQWPFRSILAQNR